MTKKKIRRGIIGTLVLLVILSYATTGSFLPWKILYHDNIVFKIIGWYFSVQLVILLFALLFIKVIPDISCTICGRDLKKFAELQGGIVFCHECQTWFHKFCRESKSRCPVCYPEVDEDNGDLLDFTQSLPENRNSV